MAGNREGERSMEMEMQVERNETVERLAAEHGLEERLAAAEARIAELSARVGAGALGYGRKTLQAKASPADGLESGIDAALGCLSLEQRIAVKSQLMRSGLLG